MLSYIIAKHILERTKLPHLEVYEDIFRDVFVIRLQPRPIGWKWEGTATDPSRRPRIRTEMTREEIVRWPESPMYLIQAHIILAMIEAGIR